MEIKKIIQNLKKVGIPGKTYEQALYIAYKNTTNPLFGKAFYGGTNANILGQNLFIQTLCDKSLINDLDKTAETVLKEFDENRDKIINSSELGEFGKGINVDKNSNSKIDLNEMGALLLTAATYKDYTTQEYVLNYVINNGTTELDEGGVLKDSECNQKIFDSYYSSLSKAKTATKETLGDICYSLYEETIEDKVEEKYPNKVIQGGIEYNNIGFCLYTKKGTEEEYFILDGKMMPKSEYDKKYKQSLDIVKEKGYDYIKKFADEYNLGEEREKMLLKALENLKNGNYKAKYSIEPREDQIAYWDSEDNAIVLVVEKTYHSTIEQLAQFIMHELAHSSDEANGNTICPDNSKEEEAFAWIFQFSFNPNTKNSYTPISDYSKIRYKIEIAYRDLHEISGYHIEPKFLNIVRGEK